MHRFLLSTLFVGFVALGCGGVVSGTDDVLEIGGESDVLQPDTAGLDQGEQDATGLDQGEQDSTGSDRGVDAEQPSPTVLVANAAEVQPLQVLVLSCDLVQFKAESYPAVFGGTAVTLKRASDHDLVLLVPANAAPGVTTLATGPNGIQFDPVPLTVLPAPSIPDPAVALASSIEVTRTALDALQAGVNVSSSTDIQPYVDALRQNVEALSLQIDELSPADKAMAAQFLAANSDTAPDVEPILFGWLDLSPARTRLVKAVAKFVILQTVAIAASELPPAYFLAQLAANDAAVDVMGAYYAVVNEPVAPSDDFGVTSAGDTGARSRFMATAIAPLVFQSGVAREVRFNGSFRTIGPEDADCGNQVADEIFAALDRLQNPWNDLSASLPVPLGPAPSISRAGTTRTSLDPSMLSCDVGTSKYGIVDLTGFTTTVDAIVLTFEGTAPNEFTIELTWSNGQDTPIVIDVPAILQRDPTSAPSCSPCSSDNDCGAGGICTPISDAKHCTRACVEDAQCDEGYVCFSASSAFKVCIPEQYECPD